MSSGVCFVVGARPNFMKTAPVMRALRDQSPDLEVLLVHTGQHYDEDMSDVFLRELDLPRPDVFLDVGSGTHGEQTARALVGVEATLVEREPALVVVSGDVNSTLAAALAAVKLAIPVAHVEAGLRSFDETMPEEHNRRLTDHVSSLLFVHSASAVQNLEREGIDAARIQLVGNTMIDSLLLNLESARALHPWEGFGLEEGCYGLVTLHRPALADDPALLAAAVDGLVALAATAPLVFPVHPRTAQHLEALGLRAALVRAGVILTTPLGYLAFLGLEASARFVVTDSGGVQEETSALGVRCFTLRATTERPVTVELGTNTLLGLAPERLLEIPELLRQVCAPTTIPLWDGHAGERCADAIAAFLAEAPAPAVATA